MGVPNRAWARSTAALASSAMVLGASSSKSAGKAGEAMREVGGDPVGRGQPCSHASGSGATLSSLLLIPDVHPHVGKERARGQETPDGEGLRRTRAAAPVS
jgi:hypothetical protein